MPLNLIALCGPPGDPTVKRIRTSGSVQGQLDGFFVALEGQFRHGIERERGFDARWIAADDELITLPINNEARIVRDRLLAGILALDEIDVDRFENEQIRAVGAVLVAGGQSRILLQAFSAVQRLSRRFALVSNGNTFDHLQASAFTLANQFDVAIEDDLIKFRKFNLAKRVLDLSENYREATDLEIRAFCELDTIAANSAALIPLATQPIRKLIASVQSSGVLDANTADEIRRKAAGIINVQVADGKLVVPSSRRELKDFLTFLDHGIYRSPVDDSMFETNSRRRRQP